MHWRSVEGFESEASRAAKHAVAYINQLTEEVRHLCRKLSITRLSDAKMVFPNEKVGFGSQSTFDESLGRARLQAGTTLWSYVPVISLWSLSLAWLGSPPPPDHQAP